MSFSHQTRRCGHFFDNRIPMFILESKVFFCQMNDAYFFHFPKKIQYRRPFIAKVQHERHYDYLLPLFVLRT